MPKVTDFAQAAAIQRTIERLKGAGWTVKKPAGLEGTVGGPILYFCHVEKRSLIAVGLTREALPQLQALAKEKAFSFNDACLALGEILDQAASVHPDIPEELRSALMLAAGLYLLGTRAYESTRDTPSVSYVILRYLHAGTGQVVLRPNPVVSGTPLSPLQVEICANEILRTDRAKHPERFARAAVLPFRFKKR